MKVSVLETKSRLIGSFNIKCEHRKFEMETIDVVQQPYGNRMVVDDFYFSEFLFHFYYAYSFVQDIVKKIRMCCHGGWIQSIYSHNSRKWRKLKIK